MLCTTLFCWLVSLVSLFFFQSCCLVLRLPPSPFFGTSPSENTMLSQQPRYIFTENEEQKKETNQSQQQRRQHEVGPEEVGSHVLSSSINRSTTAGINTIIWPRAVLPLHLGLGLTLTYYVASFTLPSLFSYLYFTTSTALLLFISLRSDLPLAIRIIEWVRRWMVTMVIVISIHFLLLYLIQTEYLNEHFPSRAALLMNLQSYQNSGSGGGGSGGESSSSSTITLHYNNVSYSLPTYSTFAIILEFFALLCNLNMHYYFCKRLFTLPPPPHTTPPVSSSLVPPHDTHRSRELDVLKNVQSAPGNGGAENKQVAAAAEAADTNTRGSSNAEGTKQILVTGTATPAGRTTPRPLTSPAVLTRRSSAAYAPSEQGNGYPQHAAAESSIPFR